MIERDLNLRDAVSLRRLTNALSQYRAASSARSVFELVATLVPFVLLWAIMITALRAGYWGGLVLVVPEAALLVRLFIIQHDCGHGSFFPSRLANDWVGRAIGVITLTPYDVWCHDHSIHHASSGNLDRRGIGNIDTLTVGEFRARTPFRKFLYRFYRHPAVMFGVGPAYLFIVRHRLPMGLARSGWKLWASAMATNAAIATVVAAMIWLVGVGPFLIVQLPVTLVAASLGVWLFYVQHQFENTSWEHGESWSFYDAALHGSSHYDLPTPLKWLTANIGVHHVHHLSSRIPSYRLPEVLRDHPELWTLGRLDLLQSLRVVRLVLWDEKKSRLVSFEEAYRPVQ